jgi:ureidoglycolate amidohydrolase
MQNFGGAGSIGGRGRQDIQEDGGRAYHDSLRSARIAPVAMLFIPCRGGVSHRPDEYARPEWIGSGVHVLARTLAGLAA